MVGNFEVSESYMTANYRSVGVGNGRNVWHQERMSLEDEFFGGQVC